MVLTQVDLDNALTQLGTIVTNEDALIKQLTDAVTALIAKIQAGASGPDLTNEVTALQSMVADISNQAAALTTSVAAAKGVTG